MDRMTLSAVLEQFRERPQAAALLGDPAALTGLSRQTPTLCADVLRACLPELGARGEAFLDALRLHLADRMFPERETACALSAEENWYLAVLDVFLQEPYAGDLDPLVDLIPLPENSLAQSRVAGEYAQFCSCMAQSHMLALLRLTRELMPFDPASHTIGVHNVALHMGLLAQNAGFTVDLPLLRAAALGHDIGKFGCRGSDAARIPYLHYYYTWQWFSENGMEEIGHISANHSTWDLEFENLPIESLLLIYADFRVRGARNADGREQVQIYSLRDSRDIIFSKLADMTEEKKRRYQTVYIKLRDFERMLRLRGVPVDMDVWELEPVELRDASLLSAQEALLATRTMAITDSIELMRTVSTDRLFEQLLEQAKSEKTLYRIRTYLLLFREYSTYMTKANKKKLLVLLYELLAHPDGDVRRSAGEIMGQILANSGPKYRKECPHSEKEHGEPPAMMALLSGSVELWEQYITLCLHPDRKNSTKHALRISNSLKILCGSLFACCEEKEAPRLIKPLLRRFFAAEPGERFVLVDALSHVPCRYLPEAQRSALVQRLAALLPDGEVRLQLRVLQYLRTLQQELPTLRPEILAAVRSYEPQKGEEQFAVAYLLGCVRGEAPLVIDDAAISRIYLSNMKNAVHWTVKIAQMELLCAQLPAHPETAFHTAMHLSNLLCVSEHLPVREAAGEQLLAVAVVLSEDQINEITIDLLRELETGQDQIARFIPPYVGRLMCRLSEKELREAMARLEEMVRGATPRMADVALQTLGEVCNTLADSTPAIAEHLLGVIMTGISHYDANVSQRALTVLCRDILDGRRISLTQRGEIFVHLHKKLLTLLSEPQSGRLSTFNRAAMLKHLYGFIVTYEVQIGEFCFPALKPAAFFPGTFDPFSVGHKQIVEKIRALGFEVYLAVDEFSWSKKTLPKLLRRQIVSISVADQWDTYLFPDDIPINIAMPHDLQKLTALLRGREVYLVAGSDVIRNASAYRNTAPGTTADYNHIIFTRGEAEHPDALPFDKIIRGKLRVLSLPAIYESVSSTRIREYVDRRLDISMLVDPVVQAFIYENGLYIRSPESKNVLSPQDLRFRTYRRSADELPGEMRALLDRAARPLGVTLCARADTMLGWAVGHTLQTADLYGALQSIEAAHYVRRHTSGRIMMVDAVRAGVWKEVQPDAAENCRMLLNELLARSLESDHTYALCCCRQEEQETYDALLQLGFLPVPDCEGIFYVDMRMPVMLLQDAMLCIKQPHHDEPSVKEAVLRTRPRLRHALNRMFPGKLLLCFDSELLNQALMERVQRCSGVDRLPTETRLAKCMCVPYGKILSDVVVPRTVTKTLHVEKCFKPDLLHFEIVEYPGYSPIRNQVRMLKSFERPVLLVDDLLHNGYRIEKLDKIFREEGFVPEKIIVAVMSGYGRDLMQLRGRQAECEYFIPNLHYWVTESLLYPFIGGDSVENRRGKEHMLPSINLILPYYYPNYFTDAEERNVRYLSRIALENAEEILRVLERVHQQLFDTALTLRLLGEAVYQPRLPDQGGCLQYDFTLPVSAYLQENLMQLERICRKEVRSNEDDAMERRLPLR